MLTQKILFLLMIYEYFQNNVQLVANELKRYITNDNVENYESHFACL